MTVYRRIWVTRGVWFGYSRFCHLINKRMAQSWKVQTTIRETTRPHEVCCLAWFRLTDYGGIIVTVLIGMYFNSLAPGRFECDFKNSIFNLVLLIGILRSSYYNALRWMPQNITGDKSTLVQVMAWCRQATSHYLSQCWPRSMTPYGVIRPQWVNADLK